MNVWEMKEQINRDHIYNIKLRVTFYARVSTDKDEQINSLENQISYYSEFIKSKPNWTYVEGYVDEGLSALSTKKRKNFNRMIDDAKNGKFDLIVTKECTRFARNTVDSLTYTRELMANGVAVLFQNDGFSTLDPDAELRLSIMSAFAQDEMRKLSSRVKFGHHQAIKNGVVLGNSRLFGYRKNNKRLVIDEEEAVMVRELYRLYATGEYSLKQLENHLYDMGYRNHNGNKIAHTTLSNIIANPKYKGYYVGNKVKVIDMFTKKQQFLPQEEWVMFKDEEIVPAIVSEEIWEKANEILERRSADVKNRQGHCNHQNLMTGKLYCKHCGAAYYRRDSVDRKGNPDSKWVCSGKIKNGAASCPSFPIYERELKPILFDVFSDSKVDVEEMLSAYIEMFEGLQGDGELTNRIKKCKEQIDEVYEKKDKLFDLYCAGDKSRADYLRSEARLDGELAKLESHLESLKEQTVAKEEFSEQMKKVREALKNALKASQSGIITPEFVAKYIDRIDVTINGAGAAHLDIKVYTGKENQAWLTKLGTAYEVRTGNTFKKMVESYENNLGANNSAK